MTVKRFVAQDMRRALDLVRQEMGPDAIILSSQRTAEGVEIITSSDLETLTRGSAERRDFGRRFDEELDQPLPSDAAWQHQAGAVEAARQYRGDVRVSKPAADPSAAAQHHLDTAAASRAARLAREIEAARERMIAAKQQTPPARNAPEPRATAKVQVEAPRQTPAQSRLSGESSASATSPSPVHNRLREPVAQYGDYANNEQDYAMKSEHHPAQVDRSASVDRQMAGLQEQISRLTRAQTERRQQQEDARLRALQSEIADMRMLLERQMWRMGDGAQAITSHAGLVSPMIETLQAHLDKLGLPSALVKKLALRADPSRPLNVAWREALAGLSKQLITDGSDCIQSGGVFAFVGPTGVGKTTTIAKLAARYVLQHGMGKVALITTDTYRVGAHDQLRSLGRILNVPVRVVDRERSLPSVIASLKAYPLILVDTAGFRQGDPLLKEQEAMLSQCPGIQRILVLACNSQVQTLKASAHAYADQRLRGCILTKVDESGSLGEILGVVAQQGLRVLYSTDGQAIPSDIHVASAPSLVAKAVALMKGQVQAAKRSAEPRHKETSQPREALA